jgi:hypothetical protein
LTPNEYTHRHDNNCKQLHLAICKKHQFTEITDPWYKYKPQTVIENDEIKLYWNRDIPMDRTITAGTGKKETPSYYLDTLYASQAGNCI